MELSVVFTYTYIERLLIIPYENFTLPLSSYSFYRQCSTDPHLHIIASEGWKNHGVTENTHYKCEQKSQKTKRRSKWCCNL